MICPEHGCNSKYKTKTRLLKHLRNKHKIKAELIHVEHVEKVPTNAERDRIDQARKEEVEQQLQQQRIRIEAERGDRDRARRQHEEEEQRRREIEEIAKQEAETRYREEFKEEWIAHIRERESLEVERMRRQAEAEAISAAIAVEAEQQRARADRELFELKAQIETERLSIVSRVNENPGDCAVCLERPSGGAAVIPCGHAYFCLPCIKICAEKYKRRGCPFCSGPIIKIQPLFG
jgi:hypothetical protein